jgi:hypothetical protein
LRIAQFELNCVGGEMTFEVARKRVAWDLRAVGFGEDGAREGRNRLGIARRGCGCDPGDACDETRV